LQTGFSAQQIRGWLKPIAQGGALNPGLKAGVNQEASADFYLSGFARQSLREPTAARIPSHVAKNTAMIDL